MGGQGSSGGRVCRKERGFFPGQSAFHTQAGGRERGAPRQMLCGGGAWSSGLGPPPPSLGSWKKSSLIGSLAVSFTLNIKVKQKSQASVLAKEGKAISSRAWAWALGPP